MKKRQDPTFIYAVIFWTSLAVIAVWIVLKAVGIINSPTWQELIPLASAIFGAGAFFQMVMYISSDLKNVKRKIYDMDRDSAHLRIDVEVLKNDIGIVKTKLHF